MEADIATQAVGLTSSSDFSILSLFLRADIIVKLVMLLLIAASVSTIIQDNSIPDEAIYYSVKEQEEDAAKQGIGFILNKLKTTMDIDVNAIQFIRDIIQRAKSFKPQTAMKLIGMIFIYYIHMSLYCYLFCIFIII